MKRETQGQKLFSFLCRSENPDILLPGHKYLFGQDGFGREKDIVTGQTKPGQQECGLHPILSAFPESFH